MQKWIGFFVFFMMFVAPVLSKAWQKMQEKAADKAAIDRAKERNEQLLRTGRAPEPLRRTPVPTAQPKPATQANRPSLEQLAAQRQAQLRELRRRQQQAARPAGAPTARQPDRLRPQGNRPPAQPARVPGMRAPQPAQRAPVPGSSRPQRQIDPRAIAAQQRQNLEKLRLENARLDAEYNAREEIRDARHRSHVAADDARMDAALKLPTDTLRESMRINAADLRRIILQAEIIGKPLALRASLDDRIL